MSRVNHVGRLLLETQQGLQQIQQQIDTAVPNEQQEKLQKIKHLLIETQHKLHAAQINAELSLSSSSSASASRSSSSIPLIHQPVIDRIVNDRHQHFLENPTEEQSRLYIAQRFGLFTDTDTTATYNINNRPIDIYGQNSRKNGRLRRSPTAAIRRGQKIDHSIDGTVPSYQYSGIDRVQPFPMVPANLQNAGLLDLINRGYLPADLDFSRMVKVKTKRAPVYEAQQLQLEKERRKRQDAASTVAAVKKKEETKESIEGEEADDQQFLDPDIDHSNNQTEDGRESILSSNNYLSPTQRPRSRQKNTNKQQHQHLQSAHGQHNVNRPNAGMSAATKASSSPSASPSPLPSSSIGSNADPSSDPSTVSSIRSYDQLLDNYSLHPFFIHDGRLLTETPEFQSFQRTYTNSWNTIEPLINEVVSLAKQLSDTKPLLTFYGSRIAELADKGITAISITEDELYSCLSPPDINEVNRIREKRIEDERNKAATLITATMKMYQERKRYKILTKRHISARIIQRKWRKYRELQKTRTLIAEVWKSKVEKWKIIQQSWIQSYASFTQKHRVHIHIPSLSYAPHARSALSPYICLYENQQLARLCELSNPLLSIIYLTASPLPNDVQQYYLKLLQVGAVPDIQQRCCFLSPEITPFFSTVLAHHPFPLASLALYSAQLHTSIKDKIRGRPALIIPSDAGWNDWMLAVELGLPLYCQDVEKKQRLDGCLGMRQIISHYNESIRLEKEKEREREKERQQLLLQERSNGRKLRERGSRGDHRDSIFQQQQQQQYNSVMDKEEIFISIGISDIYDEDELCTQLSELITQHREVRMWVLRIDDDREGRGVAYLDINNNPTLNNLIHSGSCNQAAIEELLQEHLLTYITLAHPALYQNTVSNFLATMFAIGGIILPYPSHASTTKPTVHNIPIISPSVNMLIEPNGQLTIISSHDHVCHTPFTPTFSSFPSANSALTLHTLATTIGKACWKDGVIGYVTIDFLILPTSVLTAPPTHSLVPYNHPAPTALCPVSMRLHLTNTATSFVLFNFLMSGSYHWRARDAAVYRVLKAGVKELREQQNKVKKEEKKKKFHRASTASIDTGSIHTSPSNSTQANINTTGTTSNNTSTTPSGSIIPILPTFASRLLSKQEALTREEDEEDRYYSILPCFHHHALTTLPLATFFTMCRLQSLSFDVHNKQGLCFLLYDSLIKGRVGMMGVGTQREDGLVKIGGLLRFLQQQWGQLHVENIQKQDISNEMKKQQHDSLLLLIHSVKVMAAVLSKGNTTKVANNNTNNNQRLPVLNQQKNITRTQGSEASIIAATTASSDAEEKTTS